MSDCVLKTRRFGRWDARVTLGKLGLVVEFCDMEAENAPYGKFVNDYYVSTLLGNEYGAPISERYGLSLYGYSNGYSIRQPELTELSDWLTDIQARYEVI